MLLTNMICLLGLLIGSVSDLKTREVPDWLNYSMIASGIGINLLFALIFSDKGVFIASILGFIFSLLLGYLMFYTGQWGGGDSKMIMGLGAIIGLSLPFSKLPFLLIFYINIIFLGALYGLAWILLLLLQHHKKIFARAKIIFSKRKKLRYSTMIGITGLLVLLLITPETYVPGSLKLVLASLLIMLYVTFYLWILVKSVEDVCMIKSVPPDQLTEGDWIVHKIKVGGEYICGPKDLGIEKVQIEKLKQFGIRKVTIKEGIPFVPSFLLAFIFTLLTEKILFLGVVF